jgi:hypothetical protein
MKASGGTVFAFGTNLRIYDTYQNFFNTSAAPFMFLYNRTLTASLVWPYTTMPTMATTGTATWLVTDQGHTTDLFHENGTVSMSFFAGITYTPFGSPYPISFAKYNSNTYYTFPLGTADSSINFIAQSGTLMTLYGSFFSINGTSFPDGLATYNTATGYLYNQGQYPLGGLFTDIVTNKSINTVYVAGAPQMYPLTAPPTLSADRFLFRVGDQFVVKNFVLPGTVDAFIASGSGSRVLVLGSNLMGSIDTGPVITAYTKGGARTNPIFTIQNGSILSRITNTASGDQIIFTNGYTMGRSEIITLDFANRSYTSSTRGNLLSYIAPGSKLNGWALVPGTNVITIQTTSGSLQTSLTYNDRYWSIDT